eukprot:gnl/MRDRNA2_/MRDRNA2_214912_c0_seq1.p1 gnl/MRDRNA2_/MRDRNA2_214912_c0~~gnl/MRDRNA2_/MRDRNA2_214912_c0_seq1.p1  ORF type:complete len:114 (-),score=3.90 gnl/MRDRNA2_/MRDRNA2_214912_c0_seq1:42-383(-)
MPRLFWSFRYWRRFLFPAPSAGGFYNVFTADGDWCIKLQVPVLWQVFVMDVTGICHLMQQSARCFLGFYEVFKLASSFRIARLLVCLSIFLARWPLLLFRFCLIVRVFVEQNF